MQSVLSGLAAVVCLLWGDSSHATLNLENQSLIFSLGYKWSAQHSAKYGLSEIGQIDFKKGLYAKMKRRIFYPKNNLKPVSSGFLHRFNCSANGAIFRPVPLYEETNVTVSWWVEGNLLYLNMPSPTGGGYEHVWELEKPNDNGPIRAFTWKSHRHPSYSPTEFRGYAYSTPTPNIGGVNPAYNLRYSYEKGDIYQIIGNASSQSNWKNHLNTLSFNIFNEVLFPSVWAYESPGLANKVFSSLLFNNDSSSLAIFYANYGHDFNGDKCMNETGHTTMYWGVFLDGIMEAAVSVEQSWELDGFPIVSIGRIYNP